MKNKKALIIILSLILSLTLITAAGAVTAFAVGEEEQQNPGEGYRENPPAETQAEDGARQEEVQAVEQPTEQPQEQPQAQPETSAPADNQLYEYIYGYSEDVTSAYEEPQHLAELPEVSSQEVVEATAVVIPDVAVSDATVFSGIVMWLCVALGIAVIVGVLVSKRTLRRGL